MPVVERDKKSRIRDEDLNSVVKEPLENLNRIIVLFRSLSQ
jgi:hypothetical protein